MAAIKSHVDRKTNEDAVPPEDLDQIKTYDAMNRIFAGLARQDPNAKGYVHVWNLLKKECEDLKKIDQRPHTLDEQMISDKEHELRKVRDRWVVIIGLARKLKSLSSP
jgi:hypothetical protein